VDGAAERAATAGLPARWVFTLQKPSLLPFLEYAENRVLRERIFKAYISRGDNNNGQDNKSILVRIASLRLERARLLGYATHAAYVLEENMAKTPSSVSDLLQKLWEPALGVAGRERDAMQELIVKEGGTFKLEPWDWWYYASRVKKAKYDLDENELRPYFRLENVRNGAFDVASKLFGIQFVERTDIPTYQVDVRVFEVKRTDGSHVGILYTDYFPRAGKDPGAWMDSYRQRERLGSTLLTPIVYNVGNFSRPSGDTPSLLSLDEVETLFHEFGHALFGLLSGRNYRNLDLPRDGIELPSQIMENWALTPAVLRSYACHYKTGEPIPQALIDKIFNSKKFNQGFATVEYVAAAFLDMDWHTITDPEPVDPTAFEQASLARIHLMPEIVSRYRSPFFSHIFSGDYSAGYYNYIWAEVLDADAFEAFRENGLFDPATAKAFQHFILELGGTDDPMVLYEKFRGKKPVIEPLLRKRGLL
jgi:peptidyl-dipeptidase Dcp